MKKDGLNGKAPWLKDKLRQAAVGGDTALARWLIDQEPHFAAKFAAELEAWAMQAGHHETAAVFRALVLTPPLAPGPKGLIDLTEWLTFRPKINRFRPWASLGGCLLGDVDGTITSAERGFIAQMKNENRLWSVLIDELGWKVAAGHLGKPGENCGYWLVCGFVATELVCPTAVIVRRCDGLLPEHWNTRVQARDIWGG